MTHAQSRGSGLDDLEQLADFCQEEMQRRISQATVREKHVSAQLDDHTIRLCQSNPFTACGIGRSESQ